MTGLLKSAEVARLLGIHRTTLWRASLSDASLAGCIVRQTKGSTWWSRDRLTERGYIARPAAASVPSLSFTYDVKAAQ